MQPSESGVKIEHPTGGEIELVMKVNDPLAILFLEHAKNCPECRFAFMENPRIAEALERAAEEGRSKVSKLLYNGYDA